MGAPAPSTGATPRVDLAMIPRPQSDGRRDAETPQGAVDLAANAIHLAKLVAENDAWRRSMGYEGAGENQANLPETAPSGGGSAADDGRLANREIGVPRGAQTTRPLAGAARAAVEAKECRRINRLMEEQWARSTDRSMAAAEEAERNAIPGMWAGH